MTKPSVFTMFWGHGLVFVALCLATCWFGYLSFQGSGAIVPAVIALAATAASKGAHNKRRAYQAWQREWEAMGGASTTGLSRRTQQLLGAFIIWLLMALVALSVSDDPGAVLGATLFWWGSAAVPIIAVLRWPFRRAAPRGTARTKPMTVAVCIRPPARGDNLRQAYAALPEHCRHLMQ